MFRGGTRVPIFRSPSFTEKRGSQDSLGEILTAGGEVNLMRMHKEATLISRPLHRLTHFYPKVLTATFS